MVEYYFNATDDTGRKFFFERGKKPKDASRGTNEKARPYTRRDVLFHYLAPFRPNYTVLARRIESK